MMQRQGQMEADGSAARKPPPAGRPTQAPGAAPGAPCQAAAPGTGQFFREVRDELRQVAWPTRAEMINYTASCSRPWCSWSL